jgi:UDP-glucose 4-epimerase
MKKNYIVITGGAGFVGTNLIRSLLRFKKFNILSIDNYSSGSKNNHIKNQRVKYLKGETKNIQLILKSYKDSINVIFHFGEFARIYQSFNQIDKCFEYNTLGSNEVFKFCLQNKIRLVYSATSASLGKNENKNLSPYAFFKAKNLELIENLKKWFDLKAEIIFFYNVYGSNQIMKGKMATVIGIFEDQYIKNQPLTVVKPGIQKRRFTHIDDTIKVCIEAWKKNKCKYYSISHKQSYSILEVANLFKSRIKFLPERKGERYASALTKLTSSNKIYQRYGKKNLKEYVNNFLSKNKH